MLRHKKYKAGFFVLLTLISVQLSAAQIITKKAGSQVVGYIPYFSSIGSTVVSSEKANEQGTLQIAIGAQIEVPSYLYHPDADKMNLYYNLLDEDGDIGPLVGNTEVDFSTLFDGLFTPIQNAKVRWFIIEAADGYRFADESIDDKPNTSLIEQWTTDSVKIIEELPGVYTATNQSSPSVIVPEQAEGYRLGFWALPETENGEPRVGKWVKAFDLNYLYAQQAPKFPTDKTDTDEGCLTKSCGNPTVENPGGGGGVVTGAAWIINIYDGENNRLVARNAPIKVDHEYFATIRIKDNSNGNAYRDPTPEELETLTWNIIDESKPEGDPNRYVGKYVAFKSARVDVAPADKPTVVVGADELKRYVFTTQVNNMDAADELKILPPNYSEQGWGLELTIEIND